MLQAILDYYSFGTYHNELQGWFWVIPAAISAISAIVGARNQRKSNMELARFQADANEKYLAQQNEYNTPRSQMARFQDAGLNPHLIYGQGTPGNQSSSLSYPEIRPTDYQSMFANIAPLVNQSMMTQSQVQALDAKTRQTYAMTELNKLQAKVLEKNPLLDQNGFKAIIDSLKSSAEIKASESGIKQSEMFVQQATAGHQVNKIFQEVQNLEQRFKLGTLDAQLKAQVLTSKEFQNAILEVQKKWMTDAEITPQHILQFIQLLLMKAL